MSFVPVPETSTSSIYSAPSTSLAVTFTQVEATTLSTLAISANNTTVPSSPNTMYAAATSQTLSSSLASPYDTPTSHSTKTRTLTVTVSPLPSTESTTASGGPSSNILPASGLPVPETVSSEYLATSSTAHLTATEIATGGAVAVSSSRITSQTLSLASESSSILPSDMAPSSYPSSQPLSAIPLTPTSSSAISQGSQIQLTDYPQSSSTSAAPSASGYSSIQAYVTATTISSSSSQRSQMQLPYSVQPTSVSRSVATSSAEPSSLSVSTGPVTTIVLPLPIQIATVTQTVTLPSQDQPYPIQSFTNLVYTLKETLTCPVPAASTVSVNVTITETQLVTQAPVTITLSPSPSPGFTTSTSTPAIDRTTAAYTQLSKLQILDQPSMPWLQTPSTSTTTITTPSSSTMTYTTIMQADTLLFSGTSTYSTPKSIPTSIIIATGAPGPHLTNIATSGDLPASPSAQPTSIQNPDSALSSVLDPTLTTSAVETAFSPIVVTLTGPTTLTFNGLGAWSSASVNVSTSTSTSTLLSTTTLATTNRPTESVGSETSSTSPTVATATKTAGAGKMKAGSVAALLMGLGVLMAWF